MQAKHPATRTQAKPRTNEVGSPCPDWCTVEHVTQDRTIHAHISDPMTGGRLPWDARVKLIRDGYDRRRPARTYIDVRKIGACFQFDPTDANDFAGLLEALADEDPARLRELADEVRAAAAIFTGAGQ